MSSVPAKSASVKKRGLSPVPHEAVSDIDKLRASKFASNSHGTPHATRTLRGPGAGALTCPTISTRSSTDPMPPTGACLTAETCIAKSCPCKDRSRCASSHFIKHCLLGLARDSFLRDDRYAYSTARTVVFHGTVTCHGHYEKFTSWVI